MPHDIPTLTATYQAAHPDIDWTTHVVEIRKTVDGYAAVGHQALGPTIAALLDRQPDQPRGH